MPWHPMKNAEREITDPAAIDRVLLEGKFATIAMCRGDEPYVVTLSHGYDPGRKALYFHSALEGLKIEILRANPRVCATVILDRGYLTGKCSHAYDSVVLTGRLGLVESLEEKKHGMNVMLERLEKDPDEVRRRVLKDESRYRTTSILRLDIESIRGKSGS